MGQREKEIEIEIRREAEAETERGRERERLRETEREERETERQREKIMKIIFRVFNRRLDSNVESIGFLFWFSYKVLYFDHFRKLRMNLSH